MRKTPVAVCINSALLRGATLATYSPFQEETYNWHYVPISDEEFLRRVLANGKSVILKDRRWVSSKF
ncbi:putative methyltransferase [Dickeya phage vB_DsoM_JA29]|uniref:Putative methyltransferase n=1 Tax=Dickeya phage vB_DsoM_JA29 TaxID=2283031 RepID=A0A384ZXJ8_9CAUD|nr:putative methyltransferase [Dickeya phage vB_DsoM_JA29]AXG66962.1 putative methyltransferase [Dickeya phage vB_DsoM_JA29]